MKSKATKKTSHSKAFKMPTNYKNAMFRGTL